MIYIYTYIYTYIYLNKGRSEDGQRPKLVSTDNRQKAHKNQNDADSLQELLVPSSFVQTFSLEYVFRGCKISIGINLYFRLIYAGLYCSFLYLAAGGEMCLITPPAVSSCQLLFF